MEEDETKIEIRAKNWGPEEAAVVEVEGLVGRDDSIEETRR